MLGSLFLGITSNQLRGQDSVKKITFGSLLEELTNREALSEHPKGLWKQYQVSSYERLSQTPEDTLGWYANHDWNHFQGTETINGRTESILLDVDGPGAITRFWNGGNPGFKAALRFYIDGDTIPVWEADHSGALIGENELIGAPLSDLSVNPEEKASKNSSKLGHNLYAPIPFSKHIKITYEGPKDRPSPGKGLFYNINYRIYDKKVSMESLTYATTTKYDRILSRTNQRLKEFMRLSVKEAKVPEERETQTKDFILKGGRSKKIDLKGMSSIRRIGLSLKEADFNQAVQDLWIQLSFDGKTTVNVPIGFFFGSGDQLIPASDWYHKVDAMGNMVCYWVMPFQKKASVRLINKGDRSVTIHLEIASGDYEWSKNSMYFHGNYKALPGFETKARKGRDFNFITLKSPGVYVGDLLQVTKGVAGWWGEGDEKIYIDGSSFPDHFGTGTEDYYGYAWGGQYPDVFAHPFIGQPIGQGNRKDIAGGRTVNSRVRGLDAIPFGKSLRFDMESWNWHGGPVDFAWACFWYGGLDASGHE